MRQLAEVVRYLVVLPRGDVRVRRHALEAAYGVAAGREYDARHAREPSRLEDVVRPQHVACMLSLPVLRAQVGGEVDHHVLTLERRADRVQVRYVGLDRSDTLDGAAVQRGQLISPGFEKVVLEQPANQPAHSGNQYILVHC